MEKELLETINNQIKLKNNQGKYSLFQGSIADMFMSTTINYDNKKIWFDILYDWDKECNLPIDVGQFLDKISQDDNNTVAIHRTRIHDLDFDGENVKSEMLEDIGRNGLINNGHLSSGTNVFIPEPSLTLSPFKGVEGFINLIGSYKENNVIIIYSFPSEFVDCECEFKTENAKNVIYDMNDVKPRIKPEYIVGTIIKNPNGIDKFLTHDEMLELSKKIL